MNIEHIMDTFIALELNIMPYSGRGMYGKTCVGIVTDNPLRLCFQIAEAVLGAGESIERFMNPKMDSFGMDKILYFPNIEYVEV